MDESTKVLPTAEPSWSRRKFLGAASTAAAGLMVVPRHVVGQTAKKKAPSDTLNIACVAVGGMGGADTRGCRTENIVALCDVDDESMARLLRNEELEPAEKAMYEKAAKYRDLRRMLEKEKGIDAVTVSHPRPQPRRHRHGRHQAGQARLRPETPDPYDQGGPPPGQGGQGGQRRHPDGQPGPRRRRRPPGLRVDLDRGHRQRHRGPLLDQPADLAPGRDRRAGRDPLGARRRSTGTSGSARPRSGPTIPPTTPSSGAASGTSAPAPSATWAPTSWTSRSGPSSSSPPRASRPRRRSTPRITRPAAEVVTYEFAAREGMPPVTMTWWDGGLMPPRPPELEQGRMVGDDGGGVLLPRRQGPAHVRHLRREPAPRARVPDAGVQAAREDHPALARHPPGVVRGHQEGGQVDDRLLLFGAPDRDHAPGQRRRPAQGQEHEAPLGRREDGVHEPAEANELLHFPYRPGWSL